MNRTDAFDRLQVKQTPDAALSRREAQRQVEVEESLQTLSRWLDDVVRIPVVGWRFGLDSLAGLVPWFGDTATTLVSFYILAAAVRYRVPKITILRMAFNITIDYLVGAIPFVGDLFDFAWKSNRMNMDLLKARATVSVEEAKNAKASDWLFVGLVMLFLLVVLFGSMFAAVFVLSWTWEAFVRAIYSV